MSGHHTWSEIRRQGNAGLERGFEMAVEAGQWLPELRRQAGLTQAQVAERLGVSQGWVSQIESETDLRLSTVAAYIAALGGRLRLSAVLPGEREVDLTRPTADAAQDSVGAASTGATPR